MQKEKAIHVEGWFVAPEFASVFLYKTLVAKIIAKEMKTIVSRIKLAGILYEIVV